MLKVDGEHPPWLGVTLENFKNLPPPRCSKNAFPEVLYVISEANAKW